MLGVARGKKTKEKKYLKKHHTATHECPQKIQPIRIYREHLYEYVLFYYTDVTIKSV